MKQVAQSLSKIEIDVESDGAHGMIQHHETGNINNVRLIHEMQPLAVGTKATPGFRFCPIRFIEKYPYKFIRENIKEQVAAAFFNSGQFWQRSWSVYCVNLPLEFAKTPLFVVPAEEVEVLFRAIFDKLGYRAKFPTIDGCLLTLEENEPAPVFAGVTRSRVDFEKCTANEENTMTLAVFDKQPEGWKAKMHATLAQLKTSKSRNTDNRIAKRRDWLLQLQRAQKYLGLRSKDTSTDPQPGTKFNSDTTPQSPFVDDVVFICIDVEADERNQSAITEIGLSVLDTRHLHAVPPGQNGEYWRKHIQARHFWIKGYQHVRNTKYVMGCPEGFEKEFGTSEIITRPDAIANVQACFREPSPQLAGAITNNEVDDVSRNVVLIGHDIASDLKYLTRIGLNVSKLPTIVDTLDTMDLHRAYKRDPSNISLGNLVGDFGITAWNLHNAGNDAVYTLQALLGIVVASMGPSGCLIDADRIARVAQAGADAKANALAELAVWDEASKS